MNKKALATITALATLLSVGCAAEGDELQDDELNLASEDEVDTIEQGLGETACGRPGLLRLGANASREFLWPQCQRDIEATSPDGNYDRLLCRNAYLVDFAGIASPMDPSPTFSVTIKGTPQGVFPGASQGYTCAKNRASGTVYAYSSSGSLLGTFPVAEASGTIDIFDRCLIHASAAVPRVIGGVVVDNFRVAAQAKRLPDSILPSASPTFTRVTVSAGGAAYGCIN